MSAPMTAEQIERALRKVGVPASVARRTAHLEGAPNRPTVTPASPVDASQSDLGTTCYIAAHRDGDELTLDIHTAPRTKKNHGSAFGIKQSPAYQRYLLDIKEAIASVREKLSLPLPDREYNIAATYYVDRYGKSADLNGLNQGLHDALQDAGVIRDDWFFRTTDGTHILIEHDRPPSVLLTITPI